MLKVARAETSYNWAGLLAWFTVLIIASFWPLLEGSGVASIATALAVLAMYLPFGASIVALKILSTANRENRIQLLRRLPIKGVDITLARLLSSQLLTAFAVILSIALVIYGVFVEGPSFLERFRGAWLLATLVSVAILASSLAVLLYNIAGLVVAQMGLAILGITVIVSSLNPSLRADVLEPLSAFAQTPQGFLIAFTAALLISLTAVLVSTRRMPVY